MWLVGRTKREIEAFSLFSAFGPSTVSNWAMIDLKKLGSNGVDLLGLWIESTG